MGGRKEGNIMMSLSTIREISAKAARKAAREHKTPLLVELDDMDNLYEHLRAMPFIGDYVPKGFVKVGEFFVDATGFGSPGEPALTQQEFLRRVKVGHGYAITEQGQFQVYVGEYQRKGVAK